MNDDLLLDDLGHSTQAEMCLLGDIMKNMQLIPQYKNALNEDDFEDKACLLIFRFLKDYYETFGAEFEPFKIAMLYGDYAAEARKLGLPTKADKFYSDILRAFLALGVENPSVDSIMFQTVKRNSTIRRLVSLGFPMDKFLTSKSLKDMTAGDVLMIIQKNLDELSVTASLLCTENLGSNLVEAAKKFLEEPEYGLQTPFDFINHHMHGLYKNDVTMLGGVSNSGKGRCLSNILSYLVCVENQKVFLMTNEMTISDYYKVLICTIANSPPIQALHGKKLKLTQSDIVQSRFHDTTGNIIERLPTEDADTFQARLLDQSPEYRDYAFVIQWFQDNYADKFYIVNVSDDYSPDRLKSLIRTAENMGCSVIAYDTMKAYQSAEWADLYLTATALTECIKASRSGLHGIFTFQLIDEVNHISAEQLGANHIAHSKNIINVADNMIMFKHLPSEKNRFYHATMSGFETELLDDKKYAIFKIIKNRRGGGKGTLFGVQVNLDRNCWGYISALTSSRSKGAA